MTSAEMAELYSCNNNSKPLQLRYDCPRLSADRTEQSNNSKYFINGTYLIFLTYSRVAKLALSEVGRWSRSRVKLITPPIPGLLAARSRRPNMTHGFSSKQKL